jgi:ABC-type phosphate transport system substrate-binding protein
MKTKLVALVVLAFVSAEARADRLVIKGSDTLGAKLASRRRDAGGKIGAGPFISYWRPTFYYTNGESGGLAKQFVDFTLNPGGQKIVTQVGFVSVK